MSKAVSGVRVGAAAFALGLSLAGPQAVGVAAADGGDADSSSVSAGQPDTSGHAAPVLTGANLTKANLNGAEIVYAKVNYAPKILREYHDGDLVYTKLFDPFDD